jgi:hypothetical protein
VVIEAEVGVSCLQAKNTQGHCTPGNSEGPWDGFAMAGPLQGASLVDTLTLDFCFLNWGGENLLLLLCIPCLWYFPDTGLV